MRQRVEEPAQGLAEPLLVALGALFHVDEDLLRTEAVYATKTPSAAFANEPDRGAHPWLERFGQALDRAVGLHDFGGDAAWPPSTSQRQLFVRLAGAFRVD